MGIIVKLEYRWTKRKNYEALLNLIHANVYEIVSLLFLIYLTGPLAKNFLPYKMLNPSVQNDFINERMTLLPFIILFIIDISTKKNMYGDFYISRKKTFPCLID